MQSEQQPVPVTVPREANIFLAAAGDTTNPDSKPPDDNWHWTDARALNASMGIDPEDRSAVQLRRQEVREYLGRFGKELNVAWSKWDPEEWRAMECTASREFAARRGYTTKTTSGIMKSLCEVNHRNEEQARRRVAGIVSTPRVPRSDGVKQRRTTGRKGPPLRRPNRAAQVSTRSLAAPPPSQVGIDSPLPVCPPLAFCAWLRLFAGLPAGCLSASGGYHFASSGLSPARFLFMAKTVCRPPRQLSLRCRPPRQLSLRRCRRASLRLFRSVPRSLSVHG
jgi:hypothetical protein